MLSIRVFTPPVTNDDGWPHAGGHLMVGQTRVPFLVDLRYWSIAAYERQWRAGTTRLLQGAPSTAFMMAYRGPGDEPHTLWALWRDDDSVYIQAHTVLPDEIATPFDPSAPYAHVGDRVPMSEHGLPIPEWRVDLVTLYAGALGVRWPMYPS